MELAELARHWDAFGRSDPLWAILTAPGTRGNRWDPAAFFQTGQREITELLRTLDELGLPPPRGAALDFGCGVGRLSQALAGHFERVVGVDIAASMIDRARAANRYGTRVRYVQNERDDLACLPDSEFGLIYSNIVLQHMEPRFARAYIGEFLRVLSPAGVICFQLPERRAASPVSASRSAPPTAKTATPSGHAERDENAIGDDWQPRMEMWGTPPQEVQRWIHARGGLLVSRLQDSGAGPDWIGHRYVVTHAAHPRHAQISTATPSTTR
ncbi:MAG: class I SAM-dependent methyltransferase [Planctomycetia bacterium]|nr:MAG: class I SAM-dependent methyltransferase [Planctomycetia bacterium]